MIALIGTFSVTDGISRGQDTTKSFMKLQYLESILPREIRWIVPFQFLDMPFTLRGISN